MMGNTRKREAKSLHHNIFTFRALHCQISAYISDVPYPYITSRSIRSSDEGLLVVPHAQLKAKS